MKLDPAKYVMSRDSDRRCYLMWHPDNPDWTLVVSEPEVLALDDRWIAVVKEIRRRLREGATMTVKVWPYYANAAAMMTVTAVTLWVTAQGDGGWGWYAIDCTPAVVGILAIRSALHWRRVGRSLER